MADWYQYPNNYSNNLSVNGLGSYIQYINYSLHGGLGTAFILLIFLGTFGLSIASGTKKSLAVASFISFIFSIYFLRMNMINPVIPIVLIILTIIGVIGSKSESNY